MRTNLKDVPADEIKQKLLDFNFDDIIHNITDLQETTELIINLSSQENEVKEECMRHLSETLYFINRFAKMNRELLYVQ
ncbi:MAG: hypothetical protein ACOYO1_18840 [Bacteroidales bacterium]